MIDLGARLVEPVLGRVIAANNARIRSNDHEVANPRSTANLAWDRRLVGQWADIRAEWDAFVAAGSALPRIEDVLAESQGNQGAWRMGLLVHRGVAVPAARRRFPATVAALGGVPGLYSALWSVLDAGTELPSHRGPNAGVLRYHLGVDCPHGAALEVKGHTIEYRDGESILFDDTAPHAAWNRSDRPRITLFCELERPLPPAAARWNRLTQRLIELDGRHRSISRRAEEWDEVLNPQTP